jgi:hypothetical protein
MCELEGARDPARRRVAPQVALEGKEERLLGARRELKASSVAALFEVEQQCSLELAGAHVQENSRPCATLVP